MRFCLEPIAVILVICATQSAVAQERPPATGLDAIQPVPPPELDAAGDGERVDLYGDPLPQGAVARLGTIRYRHNGWYKRVAFLPDNATFIVGTPNNTVRLWDAASGRPVREIALGDATLQAFCLSHDGELLVVVASVLDRQTREYEMRLKVWELASWNERASFGWVEPLLEASKTVALAPDGTLVATGTRNGKIRLWDLASGQEILSYDLLEGEIESIHFSPGGKLMAAASRQGAVLWEWSSAVEPIRLPELPRGGQVVRFSPDGTLLAVGASHSNAAQLYDVPSGDLNRKLHGQGDHYYREGLAFANGGQQLVVPGLANSIEFFDVATGEVVRTLDGEIHQSRDVAVSSDDRFAAIIGSESEIKLWDLESGESLSDRFVGHAEMPSEIHFLPGEKRVATGAMDGTIRIWESHTGKQQRLMRHERWVAALAATRDGTRLLSSGLDDTVRLWNAETGQEIYKLAGHGTTGSNRYTAVAFSEDETMLLSFGSDLYLRVFDTATGKALAEHAIRPSSLEFEESEEGEPQLRGADSFGGGYGGGLSFALGTVRFSKDRKRLMVATQSKTLHSFDVATGEELESLETEERFREYAVADSGPWLAFVSSKPGAGPSADPASPRSILHLRRFSDPEPMWEKELSGSYSGDLNFSPDGKLVGICLYGQSPRSGSRSWISVYSSATGEEIYRIEDFPQHSNSFAFSPDGHRLAAGYADTSVLVWDLEAFRLGP